jgi:hypothetical protein
MEAIYVNSTTWAYRSLPMLLVVRVTIWYVTHLVRYVSNFSTEREREREREREGVDKGGECIGVI